MEMKKDEQKSIVVDVKLVYGEKQYALQMDKRLRQCTQDCRVFALKNGIGKGDEVLFTINSKDQFSYLKATGNKFKLDELPKPAGAIIDADKEQEKKNGIKEEHIASGQIVPGEPLKPKTDWERKFEASQRENEIIHWQALLNTAVDIEMMQGHGMDDDVEKAVEITADKLHAFIMEKIKDDKVST